MKSVPAGGPATNEEPVRIRAYSFEEYVERVRTFHGYAAPGVILGGFMVDLAYRHLSGEDLLDALCETPKCLPDAIQLLTPCTIGNGWLKIVNLGRYALTLYEKHSGEGIRVFVDAAKVEARPVIRDWYFKLTVKEEQDVRLLFDAIRDAGSSICGVQRVCVSESIIAKRHRREFVVCPGCGEAYPSADGTTCLGCSGEPLFASRQRIL
jgi:formylmethanofuran dehydrogenase subunit E